MSLINKFTAVFVCLACLFSCDFSVPIGEELEQEVNLDGLKVVLNIKAENKVKLDIAGGGHAPIVIPTFNIEDKKYVIRLIRPNGESIELFEIANFKEAPTADQLDSILKTIHLEISPNKDAIAYWKNEQSDDSYKTILFLLENGPPFTTLGNNIAQKNKKPDWSKIPSALQVAEDEILKCDDHYEKNGNFSYAMDELEPGTKLDDVLLDLWPECHWSKDKIEEFMAPKSKPSKGWRNKVMAKAMDLITNKEIKGYTYENYSLAYGIILHSEDRNGIDNMFNYMILNCSGKNLHLEKIAKNLTLEANPARQMSIQHRKELAKRMKLILTKKAMTGFELKYAHEICNELNENKLLNEVVSMQVKSWPALHRNQFLEGFGSFNQKNQLMIMKKAKNCLSENNFADFAADFLKIHADCDELKKLEKEFPNRIKLRSSCIN